jgi:hypothetical protein
MLFTTIQRGRGGKEPKTTPSRWQATATGLTYLLCDLFSKLFAQSWDVPRVARRWAALGVSRVRGGAQGIQ